jgi:hypothetical protein
VAHRVAMGSPLMRSRRTSLAARQRSPSPARRQLPAERATPGDDAQTERRRASSRTSACVGSSGGSCSVGSATSGSARRPASSGTWKVGRAAGGGPVGERAEWPLAAERHSGLHQAFPTTWFIRHGLPQFQVSN